MEDTSLTIVPSRVIDFLFSFACKIYIKCIFKTPLRVLMNFIRPRSVTILTPPLLPRGNVGMSAKRATRSAAAIVPFSMFDDHL